MKMTLAEKMEKWKETQTLADELADQIKAEVLELGRSQAARGVVATMSYAYGAPSVILKIEKA